MHVAQAVAAPSFIDEWRYRRQQFLASGRARVDARVEQIVRHRQERVALRHGQKSRRHHR